MLRSLRAVCACVWRFAPDFAAGASAVAESFVEAIKAVYSEDISGATASESAFFSAAVGSSIDNEEARVELAGRREAQQLQQCRCDVRKACPAALLEPVTAPREIAYHEQNRIQ